MEDCQHNSCYTTSQTRCVTLQLGTNRAFENSSLANEMSLRGDK